jgi:hypothetical protein
VEWGGQGGRGCERGFGGGGGGGGGGGSLYFAKELRVSKLAI